MPLPPYQKTQNDAVLLQVKAQPRASRNEIAELLGQELKIKITAPPVDSAANEALVRFLAEIQIGDSRIMLADESPQCQGFSPKTVGGTPVSLMLYVPDVDAMFNKAVSLGAKTLQPVDDKFYGDRSGSLTDPFGHQWTISTHVEDVPPGELQKRTAALFGGK